jgi:multiple sugar transport system permease protein
VTAVTVPADERVAERQTAAPAPMSDRARSEKRLGWRLVAPAVVVMLAVTAYPMGRDVYLSLYSDRLTDPAGKKFVGPRIYGVILTDSLWWQTVFTTLVIAAVTVAVELVIGLAFALVMQRTVVGRRLVRTAILIPYGIVTVVAAYAWQYAFAQDEGRHGRAAAAGDRGELRSLSVVCRCP